MNIIHFLRSKPPDKTTPLLSFLLPHLSSLGFFSKPRTLASQTNNLLTQNTPTLTSLFKTPLSKSQYLISLINKCTKTTHLTQVHAHIIQSGLEQDPLVLAKVITFCSVSNHGDMGYGESIFETIENPDGFLYNTMIRGFANANHVAKALAFYKGLIENGRNPDSFTFSFLIKICGNLGLVFLGKQFHCSVVKYGLESNVFVRNTIVHMYGMCKELRFSRQLFDEMPSRDLVSWNVFVDCLVYCGESREALDVFLRILEFGLEPDEATVVGVLSASSQLAALDFGRWVHSFVCSSFSLSENVEVNNSLIDMYAKCGAIEEAYEIFKKMRDRSVVTWNTMILGLANHGHANEAMDLFSKLLELKEVSPDGLTFLCVLCACNHRGLVDEGRRVFDMMTGKFHIKPTMKHYGCMVDILGRAGYLEEAYEWIESMPMQCNAVVWRTLLAATRLHGNVELGEIVRRRLLELESNHSSDYVLLANMYACVGQWRNVMRVRKSMKKRAAHKPKPGNSLFT